MLEGKQILISLIAVVSVIGFVYLANNFTLVPKSLVLTSASSEDGSSLIKYTGALCVYVNGKQHECKKNIFTDFGKNLTRAALIGSTDITGAAATNITEYIALANCTTTAITGEQVDICGSAGGLWSTCGMSRVAATQRNTTTGCSTTTCPGNWTVTNEFTSSCANVTINATGLYDSSAGSNLFAQANFTTATLENNDKINITWFIWVV